MVARGDVEGVVSAAGHGGHGGGGHGAPRVLPLPRQRVAQPVLAERPAHLFNSTSPSQGRTNLTRFEGFNVFKVFKV